MMANIADCLDILARPERVNAIIGEELENIREEYGDERRSTIDLMGDPNFNKRDLIPRRDMVVTLSRGGYIKARTSPTTTPRRAAARAARFRR